MSQIDVSFKESSFIKMTFARDGSLRLKLPLDSKANQEAWMERMRSLDDLISPVDQSLRGKCHSESSYIILHKDNKKPVYSYDFLGGTIEALF